jgi:hypothetical protein
MHNSTQSHDQDEAQIILDALRQIQDSPELQNLAEQDHESVLTRLGLSGFARHAVAAGLTGFMIAAPATTQGWWQ